jgi:hypothetical protein
LYFQRHLEDYGLESCWISIIVHWDGVCCRKTKQLYRNWASLSNNYANYYLWTCDTMQRGRQTSIFFYLHGKRDLFYYTLKTEEADSSKVVALTYKITQCEVSKRALFNNNIIAYNFYF